MDPVKAGLCLILAAMGKSSVLSVEKKDGKSNDSLGYVSGPKLLIRPCVVSACWFFYGEQVSHVPFTAEFLSLSNDMSC